MQNSTISPNTWCGLDACHGTARLSLRVRESTRRQLGEEDYEYDIAHEIESRRKTCYYRCFTDHPIIRDAGVFFFFFFFAYFASQTAKPTSITTPNTNMLIKGASFQR